jgi:DNA-binding GntR family transcriptional regulator
VAFDSDELRVIRSRSLSGAIFTQLEEMILSGKIAPGERINESHLANLLSVSRAPIREACRQLEKYGMVEVKTNRGTFVREIDITEVQELYDIRACLDALAAEKAAETIGQSDLDALEGHIENMNQFSLSHDSYAYFKANLDFHQAIIQISGNRNLLHLYTGVCKKASLFRRTSLSLPGRLSISLSQHRGIVEALRCQEGARAAALIKAHVLDAKESLIHYSQHKDS